MLGKLIKHEFKASAKTMWPIFIGMASLALFIRFISIPVLNHNFGFFANAISILLLIVFFAGLFALSFAPLVSSGYSFKKGILGSEGYLTMTLPVSTDALLGARLIVNAIWYVLTGILGVGVVCILMSKYSNGFPFNWGGTNIFELIGQVLKMIKENPSETGLAFLVLLMLALCFIAFIALADIAVFASYSIGYSANRHKSLWTVLLIYGLFHVLSGIGISTLFVFGREGARWVDYATGMKGLSLFLGEELLVLIALSAALYFVTRYFITHKLNLE